jgi:hypothetical protein
MKQDQMLDMGFVTMKKIVKLTPKTDKPIPSLRQCHCYKRISRNANKSLKRLLFLPESSTAENVEQRVYFV